MVNFEKCKLYGVTNKKYLSELLRIDLNKLKEIEKHYQTAPFFKKSPNGKTRILYNPHADYKKVLQRLSSYLQQITPPDYLYGGIKKRSYVMNATVHKDAQYILSLDLKDFFPSTTDEYVYKFFRNKLQMAEDIAKICTLLTTESLPGNGRRHLPQGYSTSPYLSFLSYFDMYNGINSIAQSAEMNFSCYYDDFTISSPKFINKSLKNRIVDIINEHELKVNHKKTRLCKMKDKSVKITGTIVLNDELRAPNRLQEKMYFTFEELIKAYNKTPNDTKRIIKLCNKVQGTITAIKSIEQDRRFPHISSKLKEIREFTKKEKSKRQSL